MTIDDFVFSLIEAAAAKGERCPMNTAIEDAIYNAGIRSEAVSEVLARLAKAGKIRGGVYAHNWRTLQVLEGPHKGKSTKRHPEFSEPYIIYDRFGISRAGHRRFT